jgi:tetratricopeptide (TPR) repeat protein
MHEVLDHDARLAHFLAELAPEGRSELLHLLSCPVCRGAARESLEDESAEGEPDVAYDRVFAEVEARSAGLVKQMAEQSAEVQRLLDTLLGSPAAQQMALAGSREFGDLRLADLLLSASWSAQPEDPQRAEGLARLGLRIAEQPFAQRQAGRVEEVKARGLILLGNARRLQGDLLEADERFRQAASHLTCPPDAEERALYCHLLARLRWDQRREDEVAGLLWWAASIYREIGDLLEEGACLAELGFLFLDAGQVQAAIAPLARACPLLDLHRDALLGLRARLKLAVCYASAGHPQKALGLLATARPLYSRVTDSVQMAEVAWLEGKVTLLTGDRENATGLLSTARRSFLGSGRLYEAAFATLDVILALPKASRRVESIHPLIHDLAERFPADVRRAGVVKALGTVELAAARGREADFEAVVSLAGEALRRFRRYPLLAFQSRQGPARPPHLRLESPGLDTDLEWLF